MPEFMGQQVNWPAPKLPVTATKTYELAAPAQTHWRKATCEEVDCEAWRHGWKTTVDVGTSLGQRQEAYIRRESKRRFSAEQTGTLVAFTFEAGQACFAAANHRVPLERPVLYVVRDGDFRGNPTGNRRQHTRPEYWVEEFAEHQQGLADRLNRG